MTDRKPISGNVPAEAAERLSDRGGYTAREEVWIEDRADEILAKWCEHTDMLTELLCDHPAEWITQMGGLLRACCNSRGLDVPTLAKRGLALGRAVQKLARDTWIEEASAEAEKELNEGGSGHGG